MAFGQQAGPPASARQVKELLTLLEEAGHVDFRAARGPMGFTQRQAGGKFTGGEATAFIDRLLGEQHEAASRAEVAADGGNPTAVARQRRLAATDPLVRALPDDQLAAELRRRGWTVLKP